MGMRVSTVAGARRAARDEAAEAGKGALRDENGYGFCQDHLWGGCPEYAQDHVSHTAWTKENPSVVRKAYPRARGRGREYRQICRFLQ